MVNRSRSARQLAKRAKEEMTGFDQLINVRQTKIRDSAKNYRVPQQDIVTAMWEKLYSTNVGNNALTAIISENKLAGRIRNRLNTKIRKDAALKRSLRAVRMARVKMPHEIMSRNETRKKLMDIAKRAVFKLRMSDEEKEQSNKKLEIFRLWFFEGMTQKQIANKLDIKNHKVISYTIHGVIKSIKDFMKLMPESQRDALESELVEEVKLHAQ